MRDARPHCLADLSPSAESEGESPPSIPSISSPTGPGSILLSFWIQVLYYALLSLLMCWNLGTTMEK